MQQLVVRSYNYQNYRVISRMQMLKRRTTLRLLIFFVSVTAALYALIFIVKAALIVNGFGAKALCSCVYLSNRNPDHVITRELGRMPFTLATFSVDQRDSSATGSILGMATRKAI